MTPVGTTKLAVIGAGSVGTSVAYAALIRGSAHEIALYDVNTAKVDAEVLDLAHGTQFTAASTVIGGSDLDVVEGSDVVVITAGAKQRPGQTRLELAATNARILETLMPGLVERAPNAIYVLVTNPCDVLTVVARRVADLPAERVFGSGTVLDTSRLRLLLARRAGVSLSSVHAHIVGEHGDSEFPLWSAAAIGPVPILDWRSPGSGRAAFRRDELDAIAEEVRTAAYAVIQGKGATNYAIGLSAARTAEAVLHDERAVLPVSTVLGSTAIAGRSGFGDVALSVPSVVGASGAFPLTETPFSDDEAARLEASADAIRSSLEQL